ncbi:MAG: hypothetical protein R2688_08095 [Fimbriimonadaceae bacterium]
MHSQHRLVLPIEQSREIELGIDPAVDLFCPRELSTNFAPGQSHPDRVRF